MEHVSAVAPRPARPWIALESALATLVTLYLAIRLNRPSFWALVPAVILVLGNRRLQDYGLELRLTPPRIRTHLWLGSALLVVYGILHVVFITFFTRRSFEIRLPADPLWTLFLELLVIGFPEELFFRGYLQTNLNRIFGLRWRLFGARIGPALFFQAAVFATCHLVSGDWTRLRVFFFGLLAGWLRERSGSIAAPALYHGIGNFWYACLAARFG